MMATRRLALTAAACLGLAACQTYARQEPTTGGAATLGDGMRCAPYSGETPPTSPVARTVGASELRALMAGPRPPLLLDVATGRERRSLPGAAWLPGAGSCDRDEPTLQPRFAARMAELSAGDKARPVVVFCPNRNCWLSYNAAIRLSRAGHTNIAWFRDGTEGWTRDGGSLDATARGW